MSFKLPKISFIWQSPKLYAKPGLFLKVTLYDKTGLLEYTKRYKLLGWN
jgi:hypothetical protein